MRIQRLIASQKTQPNDVLEALSVDDASAVAAFRAALPYAIRHPVLFDMIDNEYSPMAAILLRLYDLVHHHETAEWDDFSDALFGFKVSMVLTNDPVVVKSILELLLEWSTGTVRHPDILANLLFGVMDFMEEFDTEILQDHAENREIYKKIYDTLVRLHRGHYTKDRAVFLARLYRDHKYDRIIGDMIASCLQSDRWLRTDPDARRTFFTEIADAMDATHPRLVRLMRRGDRLAVYKHVLRSVMNLLKKKKRNFMENGDLLRLRAVLEWTFGALPPSERPVVDRGAEETIRQRNKEFQRTMRSTVGDLRRRLKSSVGVPTNLPVFSQLKDLTRKTIMRDRNTEQRIITMIENLQTQVQRHRFG